MTIDWWTLGIQTVNVAVLIWLLQRFFWRPVAATIEQRRDATKRALAEADAAHAKATAALTEIEQTRAGFAKERDTILAAAHDAAEKATAARVAEAEQAAATLEATAKAGIESENRAAAHAWHERSASLAVAIAGQLAARLDGAAVHAAFLAWLIKAIEALPEASRRTVAANGAVLEIFSASALDPAEQERTRGSILKAFGGDPSIIFSIDPALIAGLELRGPNLLVGNSWRADLAEIQVHLVQETGTSDVPSPVHSDPDRIPAAPAAPDPAGAPHVRQESERTQTPRPSAPFLSPVTINATADTKT